MRANDMGCTRLSSKQQVAGSSPAGPIYQRLSAMRNHKHLCSEIDGPRHVSHGVDRVFWVLARSNANNSRIRLCGSESQKASGVSEYVQPKARRGNRRRSAWPITEFCV